VYNLNKGLSFQAVANGFLSVDSFFFLSGLLAGYLFTKTLVAGKRVVIWKAYLGRFLRLTPTYMLALAIYSQLTPHFVPASAFATTMNPSLDPCPSYWWTNLLYINNFYPENGDLGKGCMGWSWYLANDMQFFLIAPFLVLALYKWPKAGFVLWLATLTSGLVSAGLIR
jgi:peptidoglycan/LPS O-acetylase OafA/YrhL